MADKKVVVNLDFNGNTIKNVLMESVSTLPTATSSTVARFLYNSTDGYVYYVRPGDTSGYVWEKMAKGSIVDAMQTNYTTLIGETLPAMQTQIDNNTAFRDNYTHVTGSGGAVDSRVTNQLTLYYDSTEQEIQLKWGSTEIGIVSTVDFVKDGMLSGAHIITRATSGSTTTLTYDNNGTATTITPGTTSVDGKVVTTNESGYPSVDGKYMRFVFNTEPADTKTAMWVNLTDLVDAYTGGDGIALSGNTFHIDLYASNQDTDYSGLELTGTTPNKTLRVKTVSTSAIGLNSNGVDVKVDGVTITKDENSGTLSAHPTMTSRGDTVAKTAGTYDFQISGNVTVVNARLFGSDGIDVICNIAYQGYNSTDQKTHVAFTWNTTNYVAQSGNFTAQVIWA